MPSRPGRDPITQLRHAIDCLPVEVRQAMLVGIDDQPVVAGAYTDNDGGACPMLAAHRRGARTTFLAFARSWDSFTRARSARRATFREIKILKAQLTMSLLADGYEVENDGKPQFASKVDLGAAIRAHRETRARNEEHHVVEEVDLGAAIRSHQESQARNTDQFEALPADIERAFARLDYELDKIETASDAAKAKA